MCVGIGLFYFVGFSLVAWLNHCFVLISSSISVSCVEYSANFVFVLVYASPYYTFTSANLLIRSLGYRQSCTHSLTCTVYPVVPLAHILTIQAPRSLRHNQVPYEELTIFIQFLLVSLNVFLPFLTLFSVGSTSSRQT